MRNWRALLGGTVWQRGLGAVGSWQRREAIVAVVRSYETARKRTTPYVREVALLLLSDVALLRMAAVQRVGSLCWARRA